MEGSLGYFSKQKADLESYKFPAFQNLQLPPNHKTRYCKYKNTKVSILSRGLYEGVFDKIDQRMDLPKVFEHFEFKKTTNNQFTKFSLVAKRTILISLNPLGNGKVYLFSIPSDESCSNLLKHALFVPTLIKCRF